MEKREELKPIHPQVALRIKREKKLKQLVKEMHRSIMWFLVFALLHDASAKKLMAIIATLDKRWTKRFDDYAEEQTQKEIEKNLSHIDKAIKGMFREKGIFIDPRSITAGERDVFNAIVQENVQLVKSIPRQYLDNVTRIITDGIANGKGKDYIAKEIEKQFGKTSKRAEMIASDQCNKITNTFSRMRCEKLGITTGVWVHVGGGKTDRATHVKMHGKEFALKEGLYDSAVQRNIQPGELINCRCIYKPVLPLF